MTRGRRTRIDPGEWTEEELDRLIREASSIETEGSRVAFISEKFLGTRYRPWTLVGDASMPETLVIDLAGVDCFTLIDYVEAMRLSSSFDGFKKMLRRVRYKRGVVSFRNRNHFLTDWKGSNRRFIEDVTRTIGGARTEQIMKRLNEKADGTPFLEGIPPVERMIEYLPSEAIDRPMLRRLRAGDYVGIYSRKPGLDCSHVGIVIKARGHVRFRHASSQKRFRRVIDQDFLEYVADKPGIIVLRPKKSPPHENA